MERFKNVIAVLNEQKGCSDAYFYPEKYPLEEFELAIRVLSMVSDLDSYTLRLKNMGGVRIEIEDLRPKAGDEHQCYGLLIQGLTPVCLVCGKPLFR